MPLRLSLPSSHSNKAKQFLEAVFDPIRTNKVKLHKSEALLIGKFCMHEHFELDLDKVTSSIKPQICWLALCLDLVLPPMAWEFRITFSTTPNGSYLQPYLERTFPQDNSYVLLMDHLSSELCYFLLLVSWLHSCCCCCFYCGMNFI